MADIFHFKMPINNLLLKFQEFYKFEQHFDVQFVCAHHVTVKAHKMVLCSLSPNLKKIFNNLPECVHDNIVVHLPDVQAPSLRLLLKSFYNCGITTTRREYCDVLEIMEMLGIATQFLNSLVESEPSNNATLVNAVLEPCARRPVPAPRKIRPASSQSPVNHNDSLHRNIFLQNTSEQSFASTDSSTAMSQAETEYSMGQKNQVSCEPLLTTQPQSTVDLTADDSPEVIEINYDLSPSLDCRVSESHGTQDRATCVFPGIQAPFVPSAKTVLTQHSFQNQMPCSISNAADLSNYHFTINQQTNDRVYSAPEKPQPVPRASVQHCISVPSASQRSAPTCGDVEDCCEKKLNNVSIALSLALSTIDDTLKHAVKYNLQDRAFNSEEPAHSSLRKTDLVENGTETDHLEVHNNSSHQSSLNKSHIKKEEETHATRDEEDISCESIGDKTTQLYDSDISGVHSSSLVPKEREKQAIEEVLLNQLPMVATVKVSKLSFSKNPSRKSDKFEETAFCVAPNDKIEFSSKKRPLLKSANKRKKRRKTGAYEEISLIEESKAPCFGSINKHFGLKHKSSIDTQSLLSKKLTMKRKKKNCLKAKQSSSLDSVCTKPCKKYYKPIPKDIICKPCRLSEELQHVVGVSVMTRKKVLTSVWKYARENNLVDSNNKIANCDLKLVKLFQCQKMRYDAIRMYFYKPNRHMTEL